MRVLEEGGEGRERVLGGGEVRLRVLGDGREGRVRKLGNGWKRRERVLKRGGGVRRKYWGSDEES